MSIRPDGISETLRERQTIEIMFANFCWHGLVDRENRPIKSVNHDTHTGPILSATSYDIS